MNNMLNNVIVGLMMTTQVMSQFISHGAPDAYDAQGVSVVPGSQLDDHNCVVDGGYEWCEPLHRCVRSWITSCPDTGEVSLDSAIPEGCATWFDGCNTCRVEDGVVTLCTLMMCFTEGEHECLSYYYGH